MMNWTKENLKKLYLEKFGLTPTEEELDQYWESRKTRSLTPEGDRMNIAVSPLWIVVRIGAELEKTGLAIEDRRFKKVREEILPAAIYALFLKKMGFGEHLISSRDNPDIVLTNKADGVVSGTAYKRRAIPLEVTSVNDFTMEKSVGNDSAEKLVDIIEKNKLNKAYSSHTTLLVVINTFLDNLDVQKVVFLLKDKVKNFHSIDLYLHQDDQNCAMVCVYPQLTTYDFNVQTDLYPLIY